MLCKTACTLLSAQPEPPECQLALDSGAIEWARRLKRVFGIEIEQCVRCGGRLRVIASIEEPELIEKILAHRRARAFWRERRAVLRAVRSPGVVGALAC